MLKLILNKKINRDVNFKKLDRIKSSKHFPSSNREWKSSIYTYNKNNLNLIPTTDLSAISLIKNYFSLFNKNIEKNLRTRRLKLKSRRYSTNKVYISNGEFKHTNNKVIVNLYLFNRQDNNYSYLANVIKTKLKRYVRYSNQFLINNLRTLKKNTLCSLFLNKTKYFKNKTRRFKNKKIWILISLLSKIKLLKDKNNIRTRNYLKIKIEKFTRKVINNERNKRLLYWYYKQIKFLNKSKFTYIHLQYLKQQLSVLYNKQIEFNLINLKRFYLNSDILSELITKKITHKRKKTKRYMTKLINKIRIKRKNSSLRNNKINNKLQRKINLTKNKNSLSKFIIKKLKYKDVTGFRIEARGRLTRRYTASRSLLRTINKGNLLNIDSSLKGLSSTLLKGNLKSNIQYTKLASKSRIGSFGIKGWVSGY